MIFSRRRHLIMRSEFILGNTSYYIIRVHYTIQETLVLTYPVESIYTNKIDIFLNLETLIFSKHALYLLILK